MTQVEFPVAYTYEQMPTRQRFKDFSVRQIFGGFGSGLLLDFTQNQTSSPTPQSSIFLRLHSKPLRHWHGLLLLQLARDLELLAHSAILHFFSLARKSLTRSMGCSSVGACLHCNTFVLSSARFSLDAEWKQRL